MFIFKAKQGSILIEALLALAIGSTILTVVSQALVVNQQANMAAGQKQKAEYLSQEANEAVKSIWARGWQEIGVNGTYHPQIASGLWSLVNGEETLGAYQRAVTIEDIFRDGQGNIATSGGTLDPSSKKITTVVSWNQPRQQSITSQLILTRFKDNVSWQEDSLADFSDGEEDATDAEINPGYVQLAQTGGGGWSEPRSLGTVDGLSKASGITANSTHIYLSLNRTWGNIEVFDISSSPATPSSLGSFDTFWRENDVACYGDYLYVADDLWITPSVSIYNIGQNPTNPPYVGSQGLFYRAGGIFANEKYLFVSVKYWPLVFVYQLENGHYEDPYYLGYFFTTDETVDVTVSGNYLYVAQESTSRAVEIYDISSSPTSPTHMATLTTLYQPTGIYTESNILYLSMEHKRGAMYSISTDPVNPELYGYFPTQRNNVDITAYGDYGYVAGGDSQLKVIEVFDLSDSKGVSGIYFVYGEYISSVFDAGSQSAFNRIFWQGQELANTNILFQVAVNDDGASWNFVGPDGTAGSFFEEPGAIPFNHILGRYFKYKMILTGDGDTTPTVDKVIVNYSP